MGQVIYYAAASLDGFIADADGGVDWLPQGQDDDYGYAQFYSGVDALLMGRRTYDQVLSFGEWPYAGKPTYVFTRRPPDDNPHGVRFVESDAADFMREIGDQYDGVLWLVGGGDLAEQFRRANLIDECMVFIIPVVLGQGVPLFGGDAPHTALALTEAQTYAHGIALLRYAPIERRRQWLT